MTYDYSASVDRINRAEATGDPLAVAAANAVETLTATRAVLAVLEARGLREQAADLGRRITALGDMPEGDADAIDAWIVRIVRIGEEAIRLAER